MLKPLALLVRISALPHLAWSASGAIFEAPRRLAEALAADPQRPGFARDMFDGFFDHLEEQCRSRWCEGFGLAASDDGDHRRAA
jgi:hypothetical protein